MSLCVAEARCGDWLRVFYNYAKTSSRSVSKNATVSAQRIVTTQVLERQQKIQKLRPLESRLFPLYIQEWNINLREIQRFQLERQSSISFEEILQDPTLVDQLAPSDWMWLQAKVNQQIIERRFLLATASWEKRDMEFRKAYYDYLRAFGNLVDLDSSDVGVRWPNEQSDYLKAYQEFADRREKWKRAKQDIKDLNASFEALKKFKPTLFFKDNIIPHDGFYPETEEAFVQERSLFVNDCRQLGISF